MSKEVVVAYFK